MRDADNVRPCAVPRRKVLHRRLMAYAGAAYSHARALYRGFFGLAPRLCPICGFNGRFVSFGLPPRVDACCPGCLALERHRLLKLADEKLQLFSTQDQILHFAPEEAVVQMILEKNPKEYVTADLLRDDVDRRLDIEHIKMADESVDAVICLHVLEHVDDRKALAELFRILRPDGRLVVMVPIIEGWEQSYENPAIRNTHGRLLHFGQIDHVRYYGRDFRTLLVTAGFQLDEFTAAGADVMAYSLLRGEKVFVCYK